MKLSVLMTVIAALVVAVSVGSVCASVGADGDWQFWSNKSVSGNLNDTWKAAGEIEFRRGDDMSDHYYVHAQFGLSTKIAEDWTLGLALREVFTEASENWTQEDRPHIDLAYGWNWGDYKLKNRGRLEYRMRESRDDYFRFRNKLNVSLPIELGNFKPYIADEIFYDFDADELNRNRIYLGAKTDLGGPAKLDVYYMRQDSKSSGSWTDINVIGAKIALVF